MHGTQNGLDMLLFINRNGVSPNRGRAGLTALCKKLGHHGVLKHLDMTALFSYDRLFKGCFAGLHLLNRLETLELSWNALFDAVFSLLPSVTDSLLSFLDCSSLH